MLTAKTTTTTLEINTQRRARLAKAIKAAPHNTMQNAEFNIIGSSPGTHAASRGRSHNRPIHANAPAATTSPPASRSQRSAERSKGVFTTDGRTVFERCHPTQANFMTAVGARWPSAPLRSKRKSVRALTRFNFLLTLGR